MIAFALLAAGALAGFTPGETSVPGARLRYYGRPGIGTPLVLVPGSFVDAEYFAGVAAALRCPLTIVELRGHGGSQPPAERPSMRSLALDVLAAIDAARVPKPYFLGGHSIGGMLAIEIAGLRPRDLKGVIAMEGWTHHLAAQAFAMPGSMPAEAQAVKTRLRERTLAHFSAEQRAAFARVWREWDGSAILQSTTVPVLELWGDRGMTARPRRQALRIPEREGIELLWFAGATHDVPLEQPLPVAAAVDAFMRRHP